MYVKNPFSNRKCYVFCETIAQAISWVADENGEVKFIIPLVEAQLPDSFADHSVLLLHGWEKNDDYTEPFKVRVRRMMSKLGLGGVSESLGRAVKRSNQAFIISAVCLVVVFVNNNVYLKSLEKRERFAEKLIAENTAKQEELVLLETEIKEREVELLLNAEKWRAEWEKKKGRD